MSKFGKCCCQSGACDGNCCISRIDVDFAVPEPGESGFTWGSFGWDVETPPASTEETQIIDGVPRLVCKTVYTAPSVTACSGPSLLTYNVEFLTLDRTIRYDFWDSVLIADSVWGIGNLRWRVYKYVKNLTLTYYKYGSLARVVLSGAVDESAEFGPDVGYRYREYDRWCGLIYDVTKTTPFARKQCFRTGACRPALHIDVKNDNNRALYRTYDNPIQRDSGWVSATCALFPSNDASTALTFGDSFNSGASATFPSNLCRVPSGSVLVIDPTPSPCTNGGVTNWSYLPTYTPDNLWAARHNVSITPCPPPGTVIPPRAAPYIRVQPPDVTVGLIVIADKVDTGVTKFAPEIINRFQVNTEDTTLGLTGLTPSVTATQTAIPDTEQLFITTFEPSLEEIDVITPDSLPTSISLHPPVVVVDVVVDVPVADLVVTELLPEIELPVIVATGEASLVVSGNPTDVAIITGLVLTTFPPTLINGAGCDCEPAVGVGGVIGEIQTTACTAECTGGECTYIWNGSSWVETDRTCF